MIFFITQRLQHQRMPESLSGVYCVWPFSSKRPNSSVAAAHGCLFLCHPGRGSAEVETVPALGTEQTPAGIPKAFQHPGHLSLEPPRQKGCDPNRIAHVPHLMVSARTLLSCSRSSAQLQEGSASCQEYTEKLRNRNSRH